MDAGFDEATRLVAFRTLTSYIEGFALSEIVWFSPEETVPLLSEGSTIAVEEGLSSSTYVTNNDTVFESGLEVILYGLRHVMNTPGL